VVAHAALTQGAAGLDQFSIELYRPVQPMLAQTAVDVTDALERLGTASFEWKVDGARVAGPQKRRAVRVFTRSLNEVTAALPEIVELVQALPAHELILDGETIAIGQSRQRRSRSRSRCGASGASSMWIAYARSCRSRVFLRLPAARPRMR